MLHLPGSRSAGKPIETAYSFLTSAERRMSNVCGQVGIRAPFGSNIVVSNAFSDSEKQKAMSNPAEDHTKLNSDDFCLPNSDDREDAIEKGDPGRDATENKPGREMRAHARKAFPFRQLVAPVKSDLMPWPDDFIEVECSDISQSGISLFLKLPPCFKELIVCLGPDTSQTLMLAQVVRVQEVDSADRHGYIVGCRFVERVTISEDHGIRRGWP